MAGLDGNFTKNGQNCEGLRDAFNLFLPKDFDCRARYTHSPPKPCEPLFSPYPGTGPEKTRLASHFLTVSVPLTDQSHAPKDESPPSNQHVLVFAMEVLVYSSRGLITMFISKADSTGHLLPRKPSPIKLIATTFIWWLATRQRRSAKSTGTKLVISLFACAQSQYLFPGSADHGKKHVLDDRQLIRWWARVLDPLFSTKNNSDLKQDLDLQGYMTVPGYHDVEIKSFFPSKPHSSEKSRNWIAGNPLVELAEARGIPETAPPRCLLPRFPDDPKARFMQDLDDEVGLVQDAGALAVASQSGRWKTISDLERFWEAMEFRQECSSGRVVGFLWLVVQPPISESATFDRQSSPSKFLIHMADSQESQDPQNSQTSQRSCKSQSTPRKRRKPLTGPIIPREPRLKGNSSNVSTTSNPDSTATRNGPFLKQEGYDSAMQILLNLDFSTTAAAVQSTTKWVSEVSRMAGLKASEWALDCKGTAELETAVSTAGAQTTNDLGGLVRKKRKSDDRDATEGSVANSVDVVKSDYGVNILVGRKKSKS
jgi:regulator of Ty1 transposition protein 109